MTNGFDWNLGAPKPPAPTPPAEPAPTEAYAVVEGADQPTQAYTLPPATQPQVAQPQAPQAYVPPAYQPPAYQPPAYEPTAYQPPAAQPQQFQAPPAETQAFATEAFQPQAYPSEAMRPALDNPSSAIDSLFGDTQFKEYEDTVLPIEGFAALAGTRERPPRQPIGRPQRILLWVAGGLVAVLALVGVFMLGTGMPGLIPKAAPIKAAPVSTAAPIAAAPVVGPIAPGVHPWQDLRGTECLDPFTSAWEEQYTVVDCAASHASQLVALGIFADEAFAPYPGLDVLQSRMNLLCTAPSAINYAAASKYSDIEVSSSYAPTAEAWDAGSRQYFCFVGRAGGGPIEGSLAVAPVADAGPVASIPGIDP